VKYKKKIAMNNTQSEVSNSEMLSKQIRRFRWLGIAGILGAVALFSGDMLYLFDANSEWSRLKTLSNTPDQQFLLSGICALFAAWFYTLGAGQIYFALRPSGRILSKLTFLSFAAIMIGYGVAHAAYFSIITGAKATFLVGIDAEAVTELPDRYFNLLVKILLIPGIVATLLFVYTVFFRRTHYPRWIIIFFPMFLYLLDDLIVERLHGGLKMIIQGGYANLIMLLFFAISTIVLWNGGAVSKLDIEPGNK